MRKMLDAVNNPLKRKKEVENKQMEIKTMAKPSSATWISAAGSKLRSASICMSALGIKCIFLCASLLVCVTMFVYRTHSTAAVFLCQVAVGIQE